jgi:hypothetical protein
VARNMMAVPDFHHAARCSCYPLARRETGRRASDISRFSSLAIGTASRSVSSLRNASPQNKALCFCKHTQGYLVAANRSSFPYRQWPHCFRLRRRRFFFAKGIKALQYASDLRLTAFGLKTCLPARKGLPTKMNDVSEIGFSAKT